MAAGRLACPLRNAAQRTLVLLALGATGAACTVPDQIHQVSGILLEVRAQDLSFADAITLRMSDGTTIELTVSPEVARSPNHPNTASHLRQHMSAADKVQVRYRETPLGPVAIEVLDG